MHGDSSMNNASGLVPRSTRYLVFLVLFLIVNEIYDTYTTQYPSIIVDLVIDEFSLQQGQYSFLLGIITLGTYFVFLSQYLADRIGRRIMLLVTLFGMGFASFWIGISTTPIEYTIASFFLAIFFSSDIWTMVMIEESPNMHRGKLVNIVLVGGCAGALLVPMLFDALVVSAGFSWRSMTWLAMLAMGFALLTVFVKETRAYEALKEKRMGGMPSARHSIGRVLSDWKEPFSLKNRARTAIIVLLGFTIGMNYYFILMGKEFLVRDRLFSQDGASDVILVMGIAAIAGYLVNGFLIDKIGRRKTITLFLICFPASVFLTVLGDGFFIYAGAAVVSMSFWNVGICSRIYCQELYPTRLRGQMAGWRSLFYAIGTTAGSLLGGIMLVATSIDLGVIFVMYSLSLVIFIPIISRFLPETKGVELASMA